jgi:hypothetical protein
MRMRLELPPEVCWGIGAVIAVWGGHLVLDGAAPEPRIANTIGALGLVLQTHIPQLIRYSALA